jgi:hypothetical protein
MKEVWITVDCDRGFGPKVGPHITGEQEESQGGDLKPHCVLAVRLLSSTTEIM